MKQAASSTFKETDAVKQKMFRLHSIAKGININPGPQQI